MPQSLVKLLVHVVFSTKHRADFIAPEIEDELYRYLHGIVANNGGVMLAGNGTTNHCHLLISLGRKVSISELVGDLKRDSSKWIKTKGAQFQQFYWQEGYGAFSVGQDQIEVVKQYIANQKEHHQTKNFQDEMRGFFRKYGIEFDERYVWD